MVGPLHRQFYQSRVHRDKILLSMSSCLRYCLFVQRNLANTVKQRSSPKQNVHKRLNFILFTQQNHMKKQIKAKEIIWNLHKCIIGLSESNIRRNYIQLQFSTSEAARTTDLLHHILPLLKRKPNSIFVHVSKKCFH